MALLLTGFLSATILTARSARLTTATVAAAVSLRRSGSYVVVVLTRAVLLSVVPSARVSLTLAITVTVVEEPAGIEARLTVALVPVPLQLPAVVLHERKAVPFGRVSLTVTDVASSGPVFETVSV